MFDLEKAVVDWRRQIRASGVRGEEALDELESHLREEIQRQTHRGHDGPKAFEIAARKIGQPDLLTDEFRKNERKRMTRNLIILLGIFAILFGPAIFLPALAQHRHDGVWRTDIVIPLVIGAVITLIGFGVAVRGFVLRKA